jgi:hypothetical protein
MCLGIRLKAIVAANIFHVGESGLLAACCGENPEITGSS